MAAPQDPKVTRDPLLHAVLEDLSRVQSEAEQLAAEHRARQILNKASLFGTLEQEERRLLCYVSAWASNGQIEHSDAAPLGSMLDAIGDVRGIDLMIHSPGGVGEMAEKLVEMCRARAREEFRVIVPNSAKSAATMIALGADVIVMGDPSELGPIDPQYEVAIAGVPHGISGQSFVQAYDKAQEQVKELVAAGESPVGVLQSLATTTMEPAFIEDCRRGIAFSRDVARNFLRDYHLPAKSGAAGNKTSDRQMGQQARRAADNLLSARTRFSHGRLIGGTEARDEIGLHVELLGRDDPTWTAYWELYVRAVVYMQSLPSLGERPAAKLFFDRESTLPAY